MNKAVGRITNTISFGRPSLVKLILGTLVQNIQELHVPMYSIRRYDGKKWHEKFTFQTAAFFCDEELMVEETGLKPLSTFQFQ